MYAFHFKGASLVRNIILLTCSCIPAARHTVQTSSVHEGLAGVQHQLHNSLQGRAGHS